MQMALEKQRTRTPSLEMAIAVLVALAQEAERHDNLTQAEALFKRASGQAERYYGPNSISLATILWDLSAVYEKQGRFNEADELSIRVREILQVYKRQVLGRKEASDCVGDA